MKPIHLFFMASIAFLASCSDDKYLPDVEKFYYPIPDTPLTEEVSLGAYYFVYTQTEWDNKYPDRPELGEYDLRANPSLMGKHFDWAAAGGIDYFILSWNNAAEDVKFLEDYANYYKSQGPAMVINYNLSHLNATNDSPLTGEKLEQMLTELKQLYIQHLSKEYYYKIGGRPVVMITSLIPGSSQLNAIDFAHVMASVREEFKKLSVDPYFIGELPTGWRAPQTYKKNIITMDAVVLNNWAPTDYDKSYAFHSFNDISWKNWCDSTSAWKIDYVPCIFPAYNDRVASPGSKNYQVERTQKSFIDYCNVAKRNLGSQRFVIVNSWNDFNKGNTLEPAQGYGTEALEILKEQFTVTK